MGGGVFGAAALNKEEDWLPGYSARQLNEAQERYGVHFPPDLTALLRERRPARGYDWDREDPRIRKMMIWPFKILLAEIRHGAWWKSWGPKPSGLARRARRLRAALDEAPRLIPLLGHRFLPETPNEAGNPVFSMYGFDTIYYGANLAQYFENELGQHHVIGATRYIPFWSDLVERWEDEVVAEEGLEPPTRGL